MPLRPPIKPQPGVEAHKTNLLVRCCWRRNKHRRRRGRDDLSPLSSDRRVSKTIWRSESTILPYESPAACQISAPAEGALIATRIYFATLNGLQRTIDAAAHIAFELATSVRSLAEILIVKDDQTIESSNCEVRSS